MYRNRLFFVMCVYKICLYPFWCVKISVDRCVGANVDVSRMPCDYHVKKVRVRVCTCLECHVMIT